MDHAKARETAGRLAFQEDRSLGSRVQAASRRRYFRELAGSWDLWHGLYHRRAPAGATRAALDRADAAEARRLLSRLPARGDFLDLGCGTGRLLKLVAPHCRLAHGADVSPRALALAARACRGLDGVRLHRVADWTLDLPGASVDLVYSRQMFQYLDAESVVAYLKEVRRVLRPGGRFSFDLANLLHEDNLGRLLFPERSNWPSPHRIRPWTAETARAVLPRCGFRVEKLTAGPFLAVDAARKR